MSSNYWSNNLLKAREEEIFCENAVLFTAYYRYYEIMNYGYFDIMVLEGNAPLAYTTMEAIDKLNFGEGLYQPVLDPFTGLPVIWEENMSHDNLTAIISLLALFRKNTFIGSGNKEINSIWKVITNNFGRYDVINPDNMSWKRILHPRDLIFYGILNNNWLAWLFFPALAIIMIWSCVVRYEKDGVTFRTSGKLLAWLRCQVMIKTRNSFIFLLLFKLLSVIIKLNKPFDNWENCFQYYFKYDINHPMCELTGLNYKE